MPLPAHYISSVLISFSTYLERTRVPEAEKTEARRLLQAVLDQKADIECWEAKEIESFVSTHSVFSPVAVNIVKRFVEKFPPFQVCVYLNQFLLALAEDGCSNSTIRNYRSDINQFWLFAKTTDLSKLLNKTVMAQFVANEQAKGLQSSSIRRKIAAISQFGLWARRMQIISGDVTWLNNPQLLEELQKPISLKPALNPVVAPTVPSVPAVPLVPPVIQPSLPTPPHIPLRIQVAPEPTARKTQEHRALLRDQLDELSLKIRKQSQRMMAPWLTLAAIGLFFLGLGVFGYQQLILNAPRPLAYPNAPVTPNRVLSFQGRLTDTAQNPLTTATDMNFKLYDDETVGSVLWNSGTCSVTPDQDGIFNTALGSTCGAAIPSSVFSENSNVWLEVTVESETLTPRQPIWTVPYALNSETLQGYPISASGAATANTVVTMDSSGDIVIGEVSPEIRSTSGTFTITGQSLLLQTQNNGSIILDANGTGFLDVRDYLAAPGATFSATYAGGVPLTINHVVGATGNLTTWNVNGSQIAAMTPQGLTLGLSLQSGDSIATSGDIRVQSGAKFFFETSGTGNSLYRDTGTGDSVLTGNTAIRFGSTSSTSLLVLNTSTGGLTVNSLNTPGGVIYAQSGGLLAATAAGNTDDCLLSAGAGTPTWGSCAGAVASSIPWQIVNGTAQLKNTTLDLLVGGTSTASAKFAVLNINSGVPTASIAGTTTGAATYITGEGTIATTRNRSLLINPNGGFVGIGTTNPLSALHVNGNITLPNAGIIRFDDGTGAMIRESSNGIDIYTGSIGSVLAIRADGSGNVTINDNGEMVTFRVESDTDASMIYGDGITGRVGIGTSTPRAKLDIEGGASLSGTLAFRGTTDPKIDILNAENFGIRTSPGGDAGLTERFTVLNNGRLGIGTTSPVTTLQIQGSSLTASGSALISGGDYTTGTITGHRKFFPLESAGGYSGVVGVPNGSTPDLPTLSSYGSVGVVGSSTGLTGGRAQIGVFGHGYFDQALGGNSSNNANGGYFLARLTSAVTDFNGSLRGSYNVGDSRGGTQTGGAVFGTYSEGIGETNNRVFGGYFSATGGTTNYGIYSNAGINYFNGPVTVGNVSPSGLLEVSGSPWLTNSALAILNQNSTGNILVASSAGVTRTVISNNGSVGIGTSSPSQALHVVGNAYFDTSAGELTIQNTGSSSVELYGSGSLLFDTAAAQSIGFEIGNSRIATIVNGNFGIGTTTPGGFFSVGSTSQFQVNSSGAITAATGITSSGTITFSGLNVAGGVVYTNGSGVLSSVAGNLGECLISNGSSAPSWSNCLAGQTNYWRLSNGAFSTVNDTADLLIGSNATASAKFAFLNVNSGTPTASIAGTTSGAATYITGEGTIATTQNRSLALNPNGGNIGIGTTNPVDTLSIGSSANYQIGAFANNSDGAGFKAYVSGTELWRFGRATTVDNSFAFRDGSINAVVFEDNITAANSLYIRGSTGSWNNGYVGIGTSTPTAKLDVAGSASLSGTLAFRGTTDPKIDILNGEHFGIRTSGGGDADLSEKFTVLNNGRIGIGTSSPNSNLQGVSTGNFGAYFDGNQSLSESSGSLYLRGRYVSANTQLFLSSGGSNAYVQATGGNDLIIQHASAGKGILFYDNTSTLIMRLTNSGLVGIGTTSPLATLDVRAKTGIIPAASISGQTSVAALFVDNSGTGDLFTASKSGAPKFVITNAGNVGIGTTTPSELLSVNGNVLINDRLAHLGSAGSYLDFGDGVFSSFNSLNIRAGNLSGDESEGISFSKYGSSTAVMYIDTHNGEIGIGTTNPTSMFSVGSTSQFQVNSSGAIAAATGITSSGTITLSAFSNNGGLLYTDGSGVVAQTAVGSNGDCLLSAGGGSPTWGSCAGAVEGSIPWQIVNGTAQLKNTTLDMLVGGTSSASAKFAFLNVNSGTPTASIAGTTTGAATYITGEGTIATTNNRSLLLNPTGGHVGIGTTNPAYPLEVNGTIAFSGSGGNLRNATGTQVYLSGGDMTLTAIDDLTVNIGTGTGNTFSINTDNFFVQGSGNIGIGTTTPTALLDVAGSASLSGTLAFRGTTDPTIDILNGENFGIRTSVGGDAGLTERLTILANGNVGIGSTTPGYPLTVTGDAQVAGDLRLNSNSSIRFGGGEGITGNLQVDGTGSLSIGNHGFLDDLIFKPNGVEAGRWLANGNLGIGDSSPAAMFTVGSGDLFQVNSSGAIAAATGITSSGTITFSGLNTAGGVVYTNGSGVLGSVAGNTGECLVSNGASAPSWGNCLAGDINYWRLNSGAFSTVNDTADLLIGSNATSSAKFAFMNVNSGTPTASISGTTTGAATYITGEGTIATTQNRSLAINPDGGNVGIGTANPQDKLDVAGAIRLTTDTGFVSGAGPRLYRSSQYGLVIQGYAASTYNWLFSSPTGSHQLTNPIGTNDIVVNTGNLGIGTTTISAKVHSLSTTEQLRLGYDATYYASFNVNSVGDLTITSSGTGISLGSSTVGDINAISIGAGNVITGKRSIAIGDTIGTISGDDVISLGDANDRIGIGTVTPETKLQVSGNRGNALVMLNQTGTGDIFTASASGTTRFVITEAGNVGIGSTAPTTKLDIAGNARIYDLLFSTTDPRVQIESGALRFVDASNNQLARLTQSGNFGIGSDTTPDAMLSVGSTSQFQVNSSGAIAAATGITSSGTITFSGLNTAGGIVYTNGSGVLATSATGTTNECLLSGGTGAPTWGSCSTGATNYWNLANGALFPVNTTTDLLVGGTSTASAKFAFLNVNSGTPTASIAGTTTGAATYITGEGTIATTQNRSLLLNPSGGNVGIGTTNPQGRLQIAGDEVRIGNSGTPLYATGDGDLYLSDVLEVTGSLRAEGDIYADDNIYGPWQVGTPGTNSIGFYNNSTEYASWYLENSWSNLISSYNNGFRFGTDDTGDIQFVTRNTNVMHISETGNVGIGTTNPIGKFEVTGQQGAGSNALAIFNQTGTGDIFTASDSGTTRFVITEAGNVGIGTNLPETMLQVNDTASITTFTGDNNQGVRIGGNGDTRYSLLQFSGNRDRAIAQIGALQNNSSGTTLVFGTSNNYGTGITNSAMAIDPNGYVGIGDTTPAALFSVGTASDFQVNSSGAIAAATGITSSGTITFSGLNTAGGVVYTNGSGVLASVAGSNGDCLISNGSSAPSWGSCLAGQTNYWRLSNGAFSPVNDTADLLIGSNATSSAKFAFLNVNSGTPTASIAGNLSLQVPTGTTPATNLNVLNGGTFSIRAATTGQGDAGLLTRATFSSVDSNSAVSLYGRRSDASRTNYEAIKVGGGSVPMVHINPSNQGASDTFTVLSVDGGTVDGLLSVYGNNRDKVSIGGIDTTNNIRTHINTAATNYVGLAVEAFAGQTSNLQEWQDSSGNPLAKITASGYFLAPGATISATYAGGVPLTLMGGPSGTGDILQIQNSSGTVLSEFDEAGNLGIGTTNPGYKLDVQGGDARIGAGNTATNIYIADGRAYAGYDGLTAKFGSTLDKDVTFIANNTERLRISQSTGNVGIGGDTSPDAMLSVGSTSQFQVNSSGAIAAATGITSSGTITFSGLNTAGGVVYTNGSGVLASVAGSNGDCLISNGSSAPSWGSCSASATNYWRLNSGAFSTVNDTADLLIGSNATASAKFAFLNVNNGTPTASIAGTTTGAATYITGEGTIATTQNRSLTLNPDGGRVGIGTSTPNATMHIRGYGGAVQSVNPYDSTLTLDSSATAGVDVGSVLRFMGQSGNASNPYSFGWIKGAKENNVAGNYSGYLSFTTVNNAGGYSERMRIGANGNVGIGTTSPTAKLQLTGAAGAGGNALAIFDQTGTGDIFTASDSGTTRLALTETGELRVGSGTAGSPTYSFLTDTDSGIFSSGANMVGISVGGNERLRIDETNTIIRSYGYAFGTDVGLFQGVGGVNATLRAGTTNIVQLQDSGANVRLHIAAGGNVGIGTTTPVGKFEVNGTQLAGSNALAIFNQTGTGDIFTASDSGTTRFVITEAGNVGIGTTLPDSNLQITSSGTTVANVSGSNEGVLYLGREDTAVADGNPLGSIQFTSDDGGTNIVAAKIASVAKGSWSTGISPAEIQFHTAPASTGVLTQRMVIDAAGNVGIGTTTAGSLLTVGTTGGFTVNDSGAITAATGITSSGTITFSGLNTAGGIVYTNGSGVLATSAAGSASQCLLSGGTGAPTWGSCSTGAGLSKWNITAGALTPVNSTLDLLVGGSSTASAKFAFINVAGGTPTASIAGTTTGAATYITGEGTIATSMNRSLLLNPTGGNVGIGTTSALSRLDVFSTAVNSDVQRWMATDGSRLGRFTETSGGAGWFEVDNASGTAQWLLRGDGGASYMTGGNFGIGTTTPTAQLDINGEASSSASLFFRGTTDPYINVLNGENIGIRTSPGGNAGLVERFTVLNNGNVGIGTTTPTHLLSVGTGETPIGTAAKLGIYNAGNGYMIFRDTTNDIETALGTTTSGNVGYVGTFTNNDFRIIVNNNTWALTAEASSGFIGIGTTNPSALLSVGASNQFQVNSSGAIAAATGITNTGAVTSTGGIVSLNASSNFAVNIGTGTTTSTVSVGGGSNNVAIDSSVWDITGAGVASGLTGLTSSGTITFSGLNTAGGVVYTNGSGVLSSVAGSNGDCLISNGSSAPSWGSCSASATNYWRINSGAFSPVNDTADLLIGSNATASAKFAFLNVAGGTPTASIAGTTTGAATYITGEGTIATTMNRSLLLNPNGGNVGIGSTAPTQKLEIGGGNLYLTDSNARIYLDSGNNYLGFDGSNLNLITATGLNVGIGSSAGNDFNVGSGKLVVEGDTGRVGIGTSAPLVELDIEGSASMSGVITFRGSTDPKINVLNGENFGIRTSRGGNAGLSERFTVLSNGNVGIGTAVPDEQLHIDGGTTRFTFTDGQNLFELGDTASTFDWAFSQSSNDFRIEDNNGAITPFTIKTLTGNIGIGTTNPSALLSVGSTSQFQINSSGAIAAATGITSSGTITFSGLNTAGGVVYTNGSGVLASVAGSSGQCLTSNGTSAPSWGSCDSTATASKWNITAGALHPNNNTTDFLIGASSTSSAKLALTNVNGAWPLLSVRGDQILGLSTSESIDHPSFSLSGEDLFADGSLGAVGAIFSDDGFYANTSTYYGAAVISHSGSDFTISTNSSGNISLNSVGTIELLDQTNITGNLTVGAATETNSNAGFSMTGDDLFVAGMAGIEGNVYTDGSFIAGASTTYSNGSISQSSGETLTMQTTAAALTLQTNTSGNIVLNSAGTIELSDNTNVTGNIDASGTLTAGTANAFTVDSSGAITAATGITSSGTITLSGLNTAGGVVYTNGSGVLASVAGSSGECLLSNGTSAPSWGSCAAGGVGSYWNLTNGVIHPTNSTTDVLIGGTSTASAKVAITNINSGIPQLTVAGNVGIGTTGPGYKLDVVGTSIAGIRSKTTSGPAGIAIDAPAASQASLSFQKDGSQKWYVYSENSTHELKFSDGSDRLALMVGGNIGVGTTSPIAKLQVSGEPTAGTNALAIFNNTGSSDIIAASASGTTRFRVDTNGNVLASQFSDLQNSTYYLDPAGTTSLNVAGAIISADTITGTVLNGTTGINTGASAGTQRINNSGDFVNVRTITSSGTAPTTSDLGLYSSGSTNWMRFATNNGEFKWFSNYTNGTSGSPSAGQEIMTLETSGVLDVNAGVQLGASNAFIVNSSGEISSIDGVGHTLTDSAGSLAINSAGSATIITDNLQLDGTTFTASSLGTFTTAATLGMTSTTTLNLGADSNINGALYFDSTDDVNVGGDATPDNKFTVGSTSQFQVTSGGDIVAIGGAAHYITNDAGTLFIQPSGSLIELNSNVQIFGSLTVTGLNTAGGVLVSNGSGVISSVAGSATQCLISNGTSAPSWGSCGGSGGSSNWNVTAGALHPLNSTTDLLIGGTSTASADFAFTNINTGTPTLTTTGDIIAGQVNGTTSINTGAGTGTMRIDASGNFTNIRSINKGSTIPTTNDFGFYSEGTNNWVRFVSNNGKYSWYSNYATGISTSPSSGSEVMSLDTDGSLDVNGDLTIGDSNEFVVSTSGIITKIDNVAHNIGDTSGNLELNSNGTKIIITDDLQVSGNDLLDSTATTRLTLGSTNTFVGALTAAGGAINLGVNNSTNAINIGSGTSTGAITIGAGSGVTQNLTIGASTGTTTVYGTVVANNLAVIDATEQWLCYDNTTNTIERQGGSCTVSSRRYKQNISDTNYGLDTVMNLRAVNFNYKPEFTDNPDELVVGFIAEEVYDVMPEGVVYNDEGLINGVYFERLLPVAFKGIQDLNNKVDAKFAALPSTQNWTLTELGQLNLTEQSGNTYAVATPAGSPVTQLSAFASSVIGNLRAGMISAQKVVTTSLVALQRVETPELATNLISPVGDNDLTIGLQGTQGNDPATALNITGNNNETVASIDGDGNMTLAGQLLAQDISTASLSADTVVTEEIDATSARIALLEANMAELENIRANTAEIVNATVSGTLYADQIFAFQDKVANALKQPTLLEQLMGDMPQASSSTSLATLSQIVDVSPEFASGSASLNKTLADLNLAQEDVVLGSSALFVNEYFELNGSGYIAQSLGIGESLLIGNGTTIQDGRYEYIVSADPGSTLLQIQSHGQGSINFLAGLMTLDDSGLVTISGDLNVAGKVKTETLLTNLITSNDFTNPFQVQVAGASTESAEVKESRFEIINELGTPVATISAQGRAEFAGGIGVGAEDISGSQGQITTNKTSGKASVAANTTDVTIHTSQVTPESLIYVTPLSSTGNKVLYVKQQIADNPATPENESAYVVGFDSTTDQAVQFNWWIVN